MQKSICFRIIALCSVLVLGFAVFAGCTPAKTTPTEGGSQDITEPQYGGTLNIAVGSVTSLDGHLESVDEPMSRHIFETVLSLDGSFAPHTGVCSYELSEDFLTITLTVREGVVFHDGTNVTAEDVAASIQRWINTTGNGTNYVGKYLKADGTGIEIVDETTLKLNFASVASAALNALGYEYIGSCVMPKAICEKYPDSAISDDADYIGTGPYKLVEWVRDSYVKVDRFDGYVGTGNVADGPAGEKKAYVDTIMFYFAADSDAEVNGVLSNTYDLAENVNYTIYQTEQANPAVKFELIVDGTRPSMVMDKSEGWTANKTFRQAVLAAMDCEAVMTAAFGTDELYELDGSWYYNIKSELYNQNNIEKAKELVAESGYDGSELIYLTMESGYYHDTAVMAADLMQKAGINVRLEIVDQAELYSLRTDPATFDFFAVGFTNKADPSMMAFLSDTWPGQWVNEKKTELMDGMANTMDLDEKKALWQEMTDLIYDEVPVICFGTKTNCTMVSARTFNGTYQGVEPYYWNIWLNQG